MRIMVNGDSMEVAPGIQVTDLLNQLKLRPELVVVELNLNILKREELALTPLKEKDQIEIVRIVGGGAPSRNEELRPASVTPASGGPVATWPASPLLRGARLGIVRPSQRTASLCPRPVPGKRLRGNRSAEVPRRATPSRGPRRWQERTPATVWRGTGAQAPAGRPGALGTPLVERVIRENFACSDSATTHVGTGLPPINGFLLFTAAELGETSAALWPADAAWATGPRQLQSRGDAGEVVPGPRQASRSGKGLAS